MTRTDQELEDARAELARLREENARLRTVAPRDPLHHLHNGHPGLDIGIVASGELSYNPDGSRTWKGADGTVAHLPFDPELLPRAAGCPPSDVYIPGPLVNETPSVYRENDPRALRLAILSIRDLASCRLGNGPLCRNTQHDLREIVRIADHALGVRRRPPPPRLVTVKEWRDDGWPICPLCEGDELWSAELAGPTPETICACYVCGELTLANPRPSAT